MQTLNFLSLVVPPSLTAQRFSRFDAELAAFVLELLTLPGWPHGLASAEERLSVFSAEAAPADVLHRRWAAGRGRRGARRLRRLRHRLLRS